MGKNFSLFGGESPPLLRTGFGGYTPESTPRIRAGGGRQNYDRRYKAECPECGDIGRWRSNKRNAEADAKKHNCVVHHSRDGPAVVEYHAPRFPDLRPTVTHANEEGDEHGGETTDKPDPA